jgi:deoxyhypusine monooxygenase
MILSDPSKDLFLRYQALFSLRNIRTEEAVKALGRALVKYQSDENNNLLKHELGYVFGQLQDEHSIPFLKEILENKNECEMVRHEVAEALGSIACSQAEDILNKFKNDDVQVVRESIQVALDMSEYEKSQDLDFIQTNGVKGH